MLVCKCDPLIHLHQSSPVICGPVGACQGRAAHRGRVLSSKGTSSVGRDGAGYTESVFGRDGAGRVGGRRDLARERTALQMDHTMKTLEPRGLGRVREGKGGDGREWTAEAGKADPTGHPSVRFTTRHATVRRPARPQSSRPRHMLAC